MSPRSREQCQHDAIQVMRQKGAEFADECAMRWSRGDFGDDEAARRTGYQDWKLIGQCIREFCNQLKHQINGRDRV